MTTPAGRGRKLDGIDAHRASTLTPADVTAHDGIPCTAVARTVLDLAACLPRRAGGQVFRVDFLWRGRGVVVEADGRKFHRTDWSREEYAWRGLLLTEAGWHAVRITWRMVFITLAETRRTLAGVLAGATHPVRPP